MRILRPSRLASPIGRWWMFRKLLKCLCYGVVLGISVNPLYLRDVVGDGLSGTGAFGIPSLISLDPLPQTETANVALQDACAELDRKSTRLNSSHANISYAVFCLKKKK